MRMHAAVVLMLTVLSVPAAAQQSQPSDVLVRIGAPLHIPANESVGTAIAIGGDVTVDGYVAQAVVAVGGDVRVTGAVDGDVAMIGGTLHLMPGSRVRDVILTGGTLDRAPDAMVRGVVTNERAARTVVARESSMGFFWFASTLLLFLSALLAGRMFAAPVRDGSTWIREHPLKSVGLGVLVWMFLPLAGVMLVLTILGIPIALALFLVGMPLLWLAAMLVGADVIGGAIPWPRGPDSEVVRMVRGVAVIQLLALLPVLGGLFGTVAMLAGSGAITMRALAAWRRRNVREPVVAPGVPIPGAA